MINRKYFNFKTYEGFLAKKDQIPEDSIVFIQSNQRIWAHGKEYICDGGQALADDLRRELSKMVTLTSNKYQLLVDNNQIEEDTYYFTYEGEEEKPSADTWGFGDTFPIILTGTWEFGGTFPITLK